MEAPEVGPLLFAGIGRPVRGRGSPRRRGMGEVYRPANPASAATSPSGPPPGCRRRPRAAGPLPARARAVASSHPHILAVHDIGSDRVSTTWSRAARARRCAGGSSPVRSPPRKVVDSGCRSAGGCARRTSMVSSTATSAREPLPERGRPGQILDFGLAKQTGRAPDEGRVHRAETRTAATEAGRVMGTPATCLRAGARRAGGRALGPLRAGGGCLRDAVGPAAFAGNTPVDTLAAVLRRRSTRESRRRALPPGLERVVRRCLEKDPGERFQSAHDLGLALETLFRPGSTDARLEAKALEGGGCAGGPGSPRRGGGAWPLEPRTRERTSRSRADRPFTRDGGWKFAPRLSPDARGSRTLERPGRTAGTSTSRAWARGTRPVRLNTTCRRLGRGVVARRPAVRLRGRAGGAGPAIHNRALARRQERDCSTWPGRSGCPTGATSTVLSGLRTGSGWLCPRSLARRGPPASSACPLATLEKKPSRSLRRARSVTCAPSCHPTGQQLAFVRSASSAFGGWDVWVQPIGDNRPPADRLGSTTSAAAWPGRRTRRSWCSRRQWASERRTDVSWCRSRAGHPHRSPVLEATSPGPPCCADACSTSSCCPRLGHLEDTGPTGHGRPTEAEKADRFAVERRAAGLLPGRPPDRLQVESERDSERVGQRRGRRQPVQLTAFDAPSGEWEGTVVPGRPQDRLRLGGIRRETSTSSTPRAGCRSA